MDGVERGGGKKVRETGREGQKGKVGGVRTEYVGEEVEGRAFRRF